MSDQIGKVVHYYGKIGVAVVKLEKKLSVGDKIRLGDGENSPEQVVESMQLDHKSVNQGVSGDEVAIKVNRRAKEGTIMVR